MQVTNRAKIYRISTVKVTNRLDQERFTDRFIGTMVVAKTANNFGDGIEETNCGVVTGNLN